jgi:hypothetical protein
LGRVGFVDRHDDRLVDLFVIHRDDMQGTSASIAEHEPARVGQIVRTLLDHFTLR